MKMKDPAQNASCSQSSFRNVQLNGDMRESAVEPKVMPAATTATTPETWNSSSPRMKTRYGSASVSVISAARSPCSSGRQAVASRAATLPSRMPPPKFSTKWAMALPISTWPPDFNMPTRMLKIAIAAASFSRLSPSTRRVRRAGAPRSRKMATTAAGSSWRRSRPAAGRDQRLTRDLRYAPADQASRHQHGQHRQHQDRCRIFQQPPDVHGDRRLEQQDRQEDVEEDGRGQRRFGERPGDGIERGDVGRIQHEGGPAADGRADQRQQHGRRQAEAGGDRLSDTDDQKQAGDGEDDGGDVGRIQNGFSGNRYWDRQAKGTAAASSDMMMANPGRNKEKARPPFFWLQSDVTESLQLVIALPKSGAIGAACERGRPGRDVRRPSSRAREPWPAPAV